MLEDTEYLDSLIAKFIESKTPSQIAEMAGVTPERVISRSHEMKDEIDAISIDVQITFLMRSLNEIAREAQNDASSAVDAKDKGSLYSAAVSAIRESLRQINILKKEHSGAVAELNQKRVRELLRLFDVVVSRGVEELVESHDLDREETLNIFQSKIVEAAKEIEGP